MLTCGPLMPPIVQEHLGVLEVVAVHLIAQQPALWDGKPVDGFHYADLSGKDLRHGTLLDGPDYRDPPVQSRHQDVRLDTDLSVPSHDLTLRHRLAEHLLGQDTDLRVTDQLQPCQYEGRQGDDEQHQKE